MTDHPKRKRSRRVALVLAGAAVLATAACKEEQTEARAFPDLESCLQAADNGSLWFTADDCRTQFAAAQENYAETAPRYDGLALCEQEHGAGNCQPDPSAQQSGGGGSIFMPLLMGYMIGSMLGGRGATSQPLMRNASGGYATPAGQSFASNNGAGRVATNTFNRAPATAGRPPMSAAQVQSRGGFGASRTSTAPARTSSGG
ncbi:MAG: DUF1190 domain-containing protein [Paracoccus sp. (in: a-proteobacteria)]|uniref:DUF1190 domain-containing protein n=1 Tax=Paracoccus sp. TaxID=267 RepID=UPI0026DEBEDE|nr:DUF1190 domain-containing protein [Paracoccus sp. (in: a-proteobacteria)]MDO5621365.1 DUF1190 domain-containing protein [Paracoccus sp. (in: a-proteobacteria)]